MFLFHLHSGEEQPDGLEILLHIVAQGEVLVVAAPRPLAGIAARDRVVDGDEEHVVAGLVEGVGIRSCIDTHKCLGTYLLTLTIVVGDAHGIVM